MRGYEDEDMNGGLCFVLASEVAVVEDDKAEAPGEVVKVVMPERVEATVKAVEEVLAELAKVDTPVVRWSRKSYSRGLRLLWR